MENETAKEIIVESKENKKSSNTTYLAVVGIIVIVLIAGYLYTSKGKQTSSGATYKDGMYSAEGDYQTHVGQKHIKVTITLKNNLITDADVVNEADDKMSVKYQDAFIGNYKPLVIGKNINTVHLSKVASSSLTPNGFNSALQVIESQAKS